jgi:hypothetical protein
MAIGDEPAELIDIVNWDDLYARNDGDEAIIPGLAYRGRWTAIASPAKAGKSTVILGLAVNMAQTGITIVYLDAEMCRGDVLDRVEDWMHLKPENLKNLHYSDLPPKLDTVAGSTLLYNTIQAINPDLVIIDGLNGVVNGAENDDTTWRDFYEWAIAPMKVRGIAIISADNMGHSDTKRPRGSSVKLDKADAIIALERTDNGCKLTATHRRTAAYPAEQTYVVSHASDDGPPMTVTPVGGDDPVGTKDMIAVLDRLGAPVEIGVREARRLIRQKGHAARNQAIDAAVKARKTGVPTFPGTLEETPGSEMCPDGGSTVGTPRPVGTSNAEDPYGVF